MQRQNPEPAFARGVTSLLLADLPATFGSPRPLGAVPGLLEVKIGVEKLGAEVSAKSRASPFALDWPILKP